MFPSRFESWGSTSSVISVREALTGLAFNSVASLPAPFFDDLGMSATLSASLRSYVLSSEHFSWGAPKDRLNAQRTWTAQFGVKRPGDYTMHSTMTQPQKKTRRQMLEEFVAAKPQDAFARYGLAVECANSGDAAGADEHFKALLSTNPNYVAGYFQYGQFLSKLGRIDDARSALNNGIATACRTGDDHARSEMEAALAELD